MPANKRTLKKRRNKRSPKPVLHNIATTSPVLDNCAFHAISAEVVLKMLKSALSEDAKTAMASLFNAVYGEQGTWTPEAVKAIFEKKITHPGEQQVVLGFALKQFYEKWWRPVMLDVYQRVIVRLAKSRANLLDLVSLDDPTDFVSLKDEALAIPDDMQPIIKRTIKKVFPQFWTRAFFLAEGHHFSDIETKLTLRKNATALKQTTCVNAASQLITFNDYAVQNAQIVEAIKKILVKDSKGDERQVSFTLVEGAWQLGCRNSSGDSIDAPVKDKALISLLNEKSQQKPNIIILDIENDIVQAQNFRESGAMLLNAHDSVVANFFETRGVQVQKTMSDAYVDIYSQLSTRQREIFGLSTALSADRATIVSTLSNTDFFKQDLEHLNKLIEMTSTYLTASLQAKENTRGLTIHACNKRYNLLSDEQKDDLNLNWTMQTQNDSGAMSVALSTINGQRVNDFIPDGPLAPEIALMPLAALFEQSLLFTMKDLTADQEKTVDNKRLQEAKCKDSLYAKRAEMIKVADHRVPPIHVRLHVDNNHYSRLLPPQEAEKYNAAMNVFSPIYGQLQAYDNCRRQMIDLTYRTTYETVLAKNTQPLHEQAVKAISGRINERFDEITAKPVKRENEVAALTKTALDHMFVCANTELTKLKDEWWTSIIAFEKGNTAKFLPSYQTLADIIKSIQALVDLEFSQHTLADVSLQIQNIQQKIKQRGSGLVPSNNRLDRQNRNELVGSHGAIEEDFQAFAALLETVIDLNNLDKKQQLSARPSVQAEVARLIDTTLAHFESEEFLQDSNNLKTMAAEKKWLNTLSGAKSCQTFSGIVDDITRLSANGQMNDNFTADRLDISGKIKNRKQDIISCMPSVLSSDDKKTLKQSSSVFDGFLMSYSATTALNKKQAEFEKKPLTDKIKNPIEQSIEYSQFKYLHSLFAWNAQTATQKQSAEPLLAKKNTAGKSFSAKQRAQFLRIVKRRAALITRYSKNPLPVIKKTKKGKQIIGEQESYNALTKAAFLKMQLKLCGGHEALSLIFALHKAFRDWFRGHTKGETAPGQLLVLNQCMKACEEHLADREKKKHQNDNDCLSDVFSDKEIEAPFSAIEHLRQSHITDYAESSKEELSDLSRDSRFMAGLSQKIPHATNFQQAYENIKIALVPLEIQANNLTMRGHYIAADKLWHCHKTITRHANNYFLKDETLQNKVARYRTFSSKVTKAIEKAQKDPVISRHRETKGILTTVLVNVVLAIAGLGVIYLAAGLLKQHYTGRFFVQPKTKTEKLLGGLTTDTGRVKQNLRGIWDKSETQRMEMLLSAPKT
jgi:hypothetical protein